MVEEKKKISRELKFNNAYKEYASLVSFIISKYVDNSADVEDLTAIVFKNYFEKIDNVKNTKYYFTTSAKNTSINYLRQKK